MIQSNSLRITSDILRLIADIDQFKGSWSVISTLEPERLNSLKQVATIESIGSSTRIEGSKLSDKQVRELLLNLKIKSFANRDEQEVAGYAEVMETIFDAWKEIPITENYIKQLHRDLLAYSGKDSRHRGGYKKASNSVSAFDQSGKEIEIVLQTATPFDTPRLMKELFDWYQDEKDLHPLLTIAIFVVVFLEIHPFQDGNGRLSRVLTTILLLKAGYTYVPFSSLESLIEKNKETYYISLRETQKTIRKKTPNWQPWTLFFLRTLSEQKNTLSVKIEKEKITRSAIPALASKILDYTKSQGRITMGEAIKLTDSNRNTLKEHFKNLVEKGYLEKNGKGKGSWYTAA